MQVYSTKDQQVRSPKPLYREDSIKLLIKSPKEHKRVTFYRLRGKFYFQKVAFTINVAGLQIG
ncbi:hypothetical protein N483_22420 [Pseudoalteromonas luteoviolacea NCIMB 1944]|nr:hypothetical protein N483_22420 [Pseudoalteromonas luteoviolacea NCIMB 1944]